MDGIYLTWMISALALGVLLLPVFKQPWMNITLPTFIDFFRRYWIHIVIVFLIYNSKDILDQLDRIIMANTGLDMTPWIYAVEGSLAYDVQLAFKTEWLTVALTHFYVAGFMFICYVSIFYFAFFDDRWIADRMTLSIAWVYILAIPFYLFFNVRVTGDYIPGMETLAYDLTPEIADWFRRIDPFTNGFPSLHIGIPFAVWLCLTRFDEDRRWNKYRALVFVYIAVTAFAIIYLGIHWFVDIIGGVLIASLAVTLAGKTSEGWWNIFDERTINSRVVTVLTDPKKALGIVWNRTQSLVKRFRDPTSRETGTMVLAIFIVLFAVITWELSHQSLPAGGVEAPQEVAAADGWMVTIDNRTTGAVMLVHDLSNLDLEPLEMLNGSIDLDAPFDVESNRLAVANSTSLMVFDLMKMDPDGYQMILNKEMPQPQELYLSSSTTTGYIIQLSNGVLSAIDLNGLEIELGLDERPIARVAVNDLELAIVYQDAPTTVHFARIGGMGSIAIKEINASASVEQDAILMDWGTPVNMENASILDLVFDEAFLATTVNVSATDRLVVYNRSSDAQWLASDPKYRVSDPSMYNGILAWSTRDHFDPTKPQTKYMDGEIQFLNLTENQTLLLTSDELNQFGPQVLTDHLVYFQEDESGDVSVHIHSWTPELNVYSNILLQVGLLAAFLLAFIYAYQRQSERSSTLRQAEEE
ncbi:MAG TPA: inositol phosphorylceramide synthase [Candidatus Poseidoniales archaeon]|nr:MAG TPA: inositol phosphorylceramide synthase [Candidatus Poseidoniales archaeon]HII87460.1 inositol phosphorylceramide synthase [Candidatus Poseidoniaceae archaeon]